MVFGYKLSYVFLLEACEKNSVLCWQAGIHRPGGFLGPRARLDLLVKRKISYPFWASGDDFSGNGRRRTISAAQQLWPVL